MPPHSHCSCVRTWGEVGSRRWKAWGLVGSYFFRVALLLAVAAVLCGPQVAHADERSDARRSFNEGMRRIGQGQYDEGIAKLEEAYAILPHPNVLYNIGLAHVEAGREGQALPYLERYQRATPPDAGVERLMEALRERMRVRAEADREEASTPALPGTPSEPVADEPMASDEEVDAVEAAANYLREIAQAAGSPVLDERARKLDAVASRLRKRMDEEPQATADGDAPDAASADSAPKPKPKPGGAAPELTALVSPEARAASADLYAERVVSASRFAESPLDAPNATAIVTAQDIRLSGITDMGELLRRVAGMEVTKVAPNHSELSLRGLSQRNSNKLLILVNGRSVRLDFLGTTWLEAVPVSVEDVERIEVIRGPASALYGADAFSGIVNIITRAPGTGESFIVGAGGNRGQARGVASVTGRNGAFAYRLGGGYQQAYEAVRLVDPTRADYDTFPADDDLTIQRMWFNGEIEQKLGKDFVLSAGGQAQRGDITVQGFSRLAQISVQDAVLSQAHVSLSAPLGLNIRSFWNRFQGSAGTTQLLNDGVTAQARDVVQDIVDVDMSYTVDVDWLAPQTLTVGVGYRYKAIDNWVWLDDDHMQHHQRAYLQDVIQIGERFRIQLSGRLDRHPLLDDLQISPRGSLVVRIAEGQSVRAVVGKAFRAPSFLESYLEVQNATPVPAVSAWGVGNTSLAPESITSYELGYTNQATDFFALELNAYFNLVKDAILFTQVDAFSANDSTDSGPDLAAFDDATGSYPISTLMFVNEDATFRQVGGELGVRVFPIKGLDVYANYALSDTAPVDDADVDAVRARARPSSLHKINAGAQLRTTFGLDLSVDVHWVDDQVWVEQVPDRVNGVRFEAFDQPGYVIVNSRVGYRLLEDRVELGLTGTNLTFQKNRQHPLAQPMDTRVLGSAKLRF